MREFLRDVGQVLLILVVIYLAILLLISSIKVDLSGLLGKPTEYLLVAFGEGVHEIQVGPVYYDVGTDPKKCMDTIKFANDDLSKKLVILETAFCVPKEMMGK